MNSNTRMVVFDDDPTGIQTVHGCLLVTEWSAATLRRALTDEAPFFYVLTNTRALTAEAARKRLTEAVEAVVEANREFGYRLLCVSRSDSCLRGHFPLETDVIRAVLTRHGIAVWPTTPFAPAFIESGRVTIGGVHYMREGGSLTPVSETEFARDNVFHYTHSDLAGYIAEKGGDPSRYEIVNASTYAELRAYCDRLRAATAAFPGAVVVRSSSSLPRALSGIAERPPLTSRELAAGTGPGCFVVGSHVQKTTRQLRALLAEPATRGVELPVEAILGDGEALLAATLRTIADAARQGLTPVIYTARQEVRRADAAERQLLGQRVSAFLVAVVRALPFAPAYLVAKGGITSHDILTRGLGVRVARVMGQALTSVPCLMAELRGKPLPYIIFPGNVGSDTSLAEILRKFRNNPA